MTDARSPVSNGSGAEPRRSAEPGAGGLLGALGLALSEFAKDRIAAAAAGSAFFVLLALFPALSAIVSLYGLFATAADARGLLSALDGVAPVGVVKLVGGELDRLVSLRSGGLGAALGVSLAVSICSANSGVKALIAALEVAYETPQRRGAIRLNLVSLAFTAGAIGVALLAIATSVAASGVQASPALAMVRWPLRLAAATALVCALYRFGPVRAARQRRVLWPGACLASVGWALMSGLFSWYMSNFAHFSRTYGSLGAAVGFLTWIWLTLIVVLFGAEFNAALEITSGLDQSCSPRQAS